MLASARRRISLDGGKKRKGGGKGKPTESSGTPLVNSPSDGRTPIAMKKRKKGLSRRTATGSVTAKSTEARFDPA